jgi:P27 family predicted phage terminase small subunit
VGVGQLLANYNGAAIRQQDRTSDDNHQFIGQGGQILYKIASPDRATLDFKNRRYPKTQMPRKRKPIQLQIAEGDPRQRGKHKLQAKLASATIPVSGLDCPSHLKGRARSTWNFWQRELEIMDLDSRCDVQMLEGAWVHYARAVKADLQIAKEGITVREPVIVNGHAHSTLTRIKKHPAVAVSNAAWDKVKAFCSEFELSPSARMRLQVAPRSKSVGDVDAILDGPMLTDEERRRRMAQVYFPER